MAEKEADEYDPYEHRQVERPNTNFETATHLMKGVLGTGILVLPLGFANAGWIVAIIGSVLITIFTIYCLDLLLHCLYMFCKQEKTPILTYAQAMKLAFNQGPRCMRCLKGASFYITEFFLIFYQIGICSVYIVFIGENGKQIFDTYAAVWDVRIWMALWYIPLLSLALIPDLKRLSIVSLLGNILTGLAIVGVMFYICQSLPSLEEREKYVDVMRFPVFLGALFSALNPVAVVITIEANMKNPKALTGAFGVLSLSLCAIALLYIVFGFLGFWKYGQDSLGSVTLNIPQDEWLAVAVRVLITLAVFITFPLQAYIPFDIIWYQHLEQRTKGDKKQTLYNYLIRIGIVTIATLLAIAIPKLGLVIAFIGIFCVCTLGFIFPALLHIGLLWPEQFGCLKWILIKDCLLVICGVMALACGTYVCIRDLVMTMT